MYVYVVFAIVHNLINKYYRTCSLSDEKNCKKGKLLLINNNLFTNSNIINVHVLIINTDTAALLRGTGMLIGDIVQRENVQFGIR